MIVHCWFCKNHCVWGCRPARTIFLLSFTDMSFKLFNVAGSNCISKQTGNVGVYRQRVGGRGGRGCLRVMEQKGKCRAKRRVSRRRRTDRELAKPVIQYVSMLCATATQKVGMFIRVVSGVTIWLSLVSNASLTHWSMLTHCGFPEKPHPIACISLAWKNAYLLSTWIQYFLKHFMLSEVSLKFDPRRLVTSYHHCCTKS